MFKKFSILLSIMVAFVKANDNEYYNPEAGEYFEGDILGIVNKLIYF